MPAIKEYAQVVVEHYDYTQSAWVQDAELGDDKIISAGIRKQCCPDGAIAIGGVYAAMLNITCRMPPGMTYFQVRSARLKMKHRYAGEQNFEQLGVFYVTDCNRLAGDLYSITAQDAVGWTDTSAFCLGGTADERDMEECGVGAFVKFEQGPNNNAGPLQGEASRIISIANRFIAARCGIQNMLEWENYSASKNGWYYANQVVPNNQWDFETNRYDVRNASLLHDAFFPIYAENGDYHKLMGDARTDSSRDMLRFIAELAFGFIYAKENGKLTLGQFGQPEYGIGESIETLRPGDVEENSCEIADYDIRIKNFTLKFGVKGHEYTSWMSGNPDYATQSAVLFSIENNPYLDGFYWAWNVNEPEGSKYDAGQLNRGVFYHLSQYGGGYTIRPFRATVHKPVRFHLGQRIRFSGLSENVRFSIITSIQWTFRGGWKIACGGDDGRSMADMLRASKADKVLKNLRNDMDALRANYL